MTKPEPQSQAEPDAPKKKPGSDPLAFERIKLASDGSLARVKLELFALLLADEFTEIEAWKASGHKIRAGRDSYRRHVSCNPLFQGRLKALMDEKQTLEADPIWGESTWMANQLWRTARATGDSTMMTKAAEMRFKISQAKHEAGGGASGAPDKEPRSPGRPPAETPGVQPSAEADDRRTRLMAAGVDVPAAPNA